MDLKGSVAAVTGGASGIGKALVEALAQRGARVAVVDLDTEEARRVAMTCGNGARAFGCDISRRDEIESLAVSVLAEFGEVNLIFANAGVAVPGKITDTDPKEFAWLFEVNVGGVFSTMQVFVPLLVESANKGRPAHFIVTGSENSVGVHPTGKSSVYTATKHAVLGLTDTLRRDLDGSGVGVSIFCPGAVDTRIWDARRSRPDRFGGSQAMPADYAKRAKAIVAVGRRPEEVATLVLDGIARGDFMIITDARIRQLAMKRNREVEAALDLLDTILPGEEV